MKKLSLNASAFQKDEPLTRSQLKKVLGGGGSTLEGRCVQCSCHSGPTTCWYTKRSSHDLCVDVCGSAYFNALDPLDSCTGCTMN
ncbi:hypothetical protein SAMN05421820_104246 [Pedobacter steynii]|uniref:Natural product n=1 Tax=Pedobacter steynii TaxID=430522 RepID=A0A1G9UQI7_9SPHI|nr:hypothetical protein SAMN05421820_104246 [Pedobacter steynii]